MMDDAEFLNDLERRFEEPWTDEDTGRLWQLGPWKPTGVGIRQVYTRLPWRRKQMIAEVRQFVTARVVARLGDEDDNEPDDFVAANLPRYPRLRI